jgi:hypothetical protein
LVGKEVRQDYQLANRAALVATDVVPAYFPKPETLGQGIEFRVNSITAPWPDVDKNSFDLVHHRLGLFATGAELEAAVAGLIDLVKPGGWIQMVDDDLTGPEAAPDSPLSPSVRLINTLLGKNLNHSDAYGAKLKHIFNRTSSSQSKRRLCMRGLALCIPTLHLPRRA